MGHGNRFQGGGWWSWHRYWSVDKYAESYGIECSQFDVTNEVYFNEDSSEFTICDGSGEDADCSNSCGPLHCTSASDHLDYMNLPLGSDNCAVQR